MNFCQALFHFIRSETKYIRFLREEEIEIILDCYFHLKIAFDVGWPIFQTVDQYS